MNTQNTICELERLKLPGMKQAYNGILSLPLQEQPSIHSMMAQLTEAEIQYRLHNLTQMYLKVSKLRYDAMLEQIHCTTDRNLTKESIHAIADCGFISRGENILNNRFSRLRKKLSGMCHRKTGLCFWTQNLVFFNEQIARENRSMQIGRFTTEVLCTNRKNTVTHTR
jgi:hypothetical protein